MKIKQITKIFRLKMLNNISKFIETGMKIVKPLPICLVFGKPDFEENSLLISIHLAERYKGRVILFCENVLDTRNYLEHLSNVIDLSHHKIELKRRTPISALKFLIISHLVIYTQPIYLAPKPRGPRVHINIWHGSGPKRLETDKFQLKIPASAMAGNNHIWTKQAMKNLGISEGVKMLTGNPRQDLMFFSPSDSSLEKLGIMKNEKFVLWMPTFRQSVKTGIGVMSDGTKLSDRNFEINPDKLAEIAEEFSLKVIVKPHPLDSDSYGNNKCTLVSTSDIWRAGMSLYQLIGAASGMISDYSSVWVDYLQLHRPIAFYCPDYYEYKTSRGMYEPYLDSIAGDLFINNEKDLYNFFSKVNNAKAYDGAQEQRVAKSLKYIHSSTRAVTLTNEILNLSNG